MVIRSLPKRSPSKKRLREHGLPRTDHSRLPVRWRKLLDAPVEGSKAGVSEVPGFFFEVVSDENAACARLEVTLMALETSGQGRFTRSMPLSRERLARVMPGIREQRLATTVLGLSQTERKGRSYAHLEGQVGDALLAEMLETASCFLGGVGGLRLSHGKEQQLAWSWQLEQDGSQRLQPALEKTQRLLRVGTLWCLDVVRAEISHLDAAIEETEWLDLPVLRHDEVLTVFGALSKGPLAHRLPTPKLLDTLPCREVVPQPILTLYGLTEHARQPADTPPMAYARLSFDYAGERFLAQRGEVLVRRLHGDRLIEINRRRADELNAMEQLEQVGLTLAVDTEGLPWELVDTLFEDAWLFPGAGHSGALEVNTPARWLALRSRLESENFLFEYASSFPFDVLTEPVRWYGRALMDGEEATFGLELGIEVDGKRHNLLPALAVALADGHITLQPLANEPEDAVWYAPVDKRRRVPLKLSELRPLLAPLTEYLERPKRNLRLPRVHVGRLDELADALPENGALQVPEPLRGFTTRLHALTEGTADAAPEGLVAKLRPYQHEGLHWLNALAEIGVGGVLADDMGLGKTLQLIAHLLSLKQRGGLKQAVLIVVPTSLIPNWQSEIARFAPTLKVLVLHGPQRRDDFDQIVTQDVVLTSYALLPRDVSNLCEQSFALIVLDEAQLVKNPRTQARRALLKFRAVRCICLTGTPLENHLGELWSQMDLAVPGLLGDEATFCRYVRLPIEKQHDEVCQVRLNRRLAPFMLRRTKSQVASDLPVKTEMTRRVALDGRQRELYDGLRLNLVEELREVIAQRGLEHSGVAVLDALLKLRQVCCDPRLVKLDVARGVHESAKFELLMNMLPALLAEGRKVLLFSQFTEMLGLIADELDQIGIPYVSLTGQTYDRADPVRRFQKGEVSLFLLSLKAGGVGLNLTAADTVIHYDPWWNPAVEEQASDRAHRIGQDKPVFVFRLITVGTVEERIEEMKIHKAKLANAVLEGTERTGLRLDRSDMEELLTLT